MSKPPATLVRRLLWSAVLLAAVSLAIQAVFQASAYEWNWEDAWKYRVQFAWGWLTMLGICSGAVVVSVVTGLLLMTGARSSIEPARLLCHGIIEFIRGTPLLVQLLIGYYIVANALGMHSPFLIGTLLLGLFEGAYLAEIFRGAIESIGASQREAARAVGFDTVQTYRHVVIPQALRRALPGSTGQLVSLIKDSSLLSVIGIEELVQKVRILNSASYTGLEGYLPLAVAYLIVTLPLSLYARRLERRFAYET